jgi:adenylate kinase family enzyme
MSKKSVLITGMPGSGKSSVCKALKHRGHEAYDIEEIPGLFSAVPKNGRGLDEYDNCNLESVKRHDWVCDSAKLDTLLANQKNATAYYCGTASNIMDILNKFSTVIVLAVSRKVLKLRLGHRKKGEYGHNPAVIDWTLSWQDWWEETIKDAGAIFVNANNDISSVTDEILAQQDQIHT